MQVDLGPCSFSVVVGIVIVRYGFTDLPLRRLDLAVGLAGDAIDIVKDALDRARASTNCNPPGLEEQLVQLGMDLNSHGSIDLG